MNRIRVLLADDHAVVREGLSALLQSQGDIEVVGEAGDGHTAVRLAQELAPDVVVMDIAMPNLNGIEATERIKHARPATEVVILSMHGGTEHAFRALRAGALGYVLKESAGRLVVRAVRAAHAGKRFLCEPVLEVLATAYHAPSDDPRSPLERLSRREREVLQLVAEGHSSSVIAEHLSLSPKTVDTYRSRLMRKLGMRDVTDLVRFAVRHGLTPLR